MTASNAATALGALPLRAFCAALVTSPPSSGIIVRSSLPAVLGVDVGALATGVSIAAAGAMSPRSQSRALPLVVLRGAGGTGGSAVSHAAALRLRTLFAVHGARGLVVGWPAGGLCTSGGPDDERGRALTLLAAVRAAGINAPTLLWDETGSTAAARSVLTSRTRSSSLCVSLRVHSHCPLPRMPPSPPEVAWRVDMLAASVLLDSFLEAARRELAGMGHALGLAGEQVVRDRSAEKRFLSSK